LPSYPIWALRPRLHLALCPISSQYICSWCRPLLPQSHLILWSYRGFSILMTNFLGLRIKILLKHIKPVGLYSVSLLNSIWSIPDSRQSVSFVLVWAPCCTWSIVCNSRQTTFCCWYLQMVDWTGFIRWKGIAMIGSYLEWLPPSTGNIVYLLPCPGKIFGQDSTKNWVGRRTGAFLKMSTF
jgi:hypothetical protein